MSVIQGMHGMFYSPEAEAARAFLRDTLELPCRDVGDGWLIFDIAESDAGVHPSDGAVTHEVSFYTEDIEAAVATLRERGVTMSEISDQGYGLVSGFEMPGGVKAALYQPRYAPTGDQRMEQLARQIQTLDARLKALKKASARGVVDDYTFATTDGEVRLSALFGDRSDLLVIQNMGST